MWRHGCKLYDGDNSHNTAVINGKCDYLSVICIKKNLDEERKLLPVNNSLNFRMPKDINK
jgi:hypothetical protein